MRVRADGSTPAEVVALLWASLVDVMGSAAAATLLRRAAKLSRTDGFDVVREGLAYKYVLPPTWSTSSTDAHEALAALLRRLQTVLVDLTGTVVLRRLRADERLAPYFVEAAS
jgi:hypothetical protein